MKIIDILDKIARGEELPKKIVFKEEVYTFDYEAYDYIATNGDGLFDYYATPKIIDDEVIILETTITYKQDAENQKNVSYIKQDANMQDDKIIQLPIIQENDLFDIRLTFNQNRRKINEIIDRINNV